MTFGFGNVISLIMALVVIVFLLVFFAFRVKSIRLVIIYMLFAVVFIALNVFSWYFENMEMAVDIIEIIFLVALFTAVVVYQNEFKIMFYRIKNISKKDFSLRISGEELQDCIEEIVKACQVLSKAKTGGLIVVVPNELPENVVNSGVKIDGLVTSSLLESIFNTKAPMHDGAVVVKGNKLIASGCFLPLTEQAIAKDLGTRHRAALGITEETDNLSIVISEENGVISVCEKGKLNRYITPERLSDRLHELYGVSVKVESRNKKKLNKHK